MIIYEVNLVVDNATAEDFAVWLRAHISEMLKFDGFGRAIWYYEEPDGNRQRWTVQYHVEKWAQVQRYFEEHAARMREDADVHFGGRFSASRRVLIEREAFA